MCGILGISINVPSPRLVKPLQSIVRDLFLFSESRGKEAAGLAILGGEYIEVLKSPHPASAMLRSRRYNGLLKQCFHVISRLISQGRRASFTLIGHSRLVTTGTQYVAYNNQPVIAERMVGVHNGIIVNHEALWDEHAHLKRIYQVDTEIFLRLLKTFRDSEDSLTQATRHTFAEIEGTASVATLFEDLNCLLLATNNGSLYMCTNASGSVFMFASERYILQRVVQRSWVRKAFGKNFSIRQIPSGEGCLLDIGTLTPEYFTLADATNQISPLPLASPRIIREHGEIDTSSELLTSAQKQVGLLSAMDTEGRDYLEYIRTRFPHDTAWQDSLRRCTRCILPETMPFIVFDYEGVCNYCRNYRRLEFKGERALTRLIEQYRSCDGAPDCVVGISGGRDSLYALHYVKTVLNMHPVAYTYDWGMVTDLARRNISRICAKLGVEHILVSADIIQKRKNIKLNVTAWLKKPELGMIPLFMAGDKQYFYYVQQVRKQLGVQLEVLGENRLERTDFKTGFAHVRPYKIDSHHIYTIPLSSKLQLAWFYGQQYLLNPHYLNASLKDTAFAAFCHYIINRNFVNLYNYIPWIEETVIPTLVNEYNFELARDSQTTWRIGDGTAAFYNYIYYTVAGFTENETFRSNQIREGLLTREQALELVREENKPRYETIFWYLNIIDLDLKMHDVLDIIHHIPRIASQSGEI